MTKRVRVENAGTGDAIVCVDVFDRISGQPDVLVETRVLKYPAEMAELFVWAERYLVVREM